MCQLKNNKIIQFFAIDFQIVKLPLWGRNVLMIFPDIHVIC